jgi:hypothetical protein
VLGKIKVICDAPLLIWLKKSETYNQTWRLDLTPFSIMTKIPKTTRIGRYTVRHTFNHALKDFSRKKVYIYFKWFPTYLHNPAKDRGVVHSATVPSSMSELILAFFDACLRAFSDVLHVVLIQMA